MRLIEAEASHHDSELLQQEAVKLEQTELECRQERINMQVRREAEQERRVRERDEWLAQQQMQREMENMLSKAAALEAES
jgi:hypothetical protein